MHGTQSDGYAFGMWPVVVFNILLFLFFVISFIRPKKKVEWRSMGASLSHPLCSPPDFYRLMSPAEY